MGKEILQNNGNGVGYDGSQAFLQQRSVVDWNKKNGYALSQLKNLGFKGNGDITNKKILDVGCGGGDLVKLFNEKGARALGVDFPPEITQTKEQMPARHKENYLAVNFAEKKLPKSLEDGGFDYIVFHGVIDPRDENGNKEVMKNHLNNAVSLVDTPGGQVKIYPAPREPWEKVLTEYNSERKGHEVIFEFKETRKSEGPLDTPNEVLIIRKENRVNFQA